MKKKMIRRCRKTGKQKSKRDRRAADLERVLIEGGKCRLADGLTLTVEVIKDKPLLDVLEELE